jgi:hypothetical protein
MEEKECGKPTNGIMTFIHQEDYRRMVKSFLIFGAIVISITVLDPIDLLIGD